MKVLTVAQMNAVDRATVERGIPDIILMENAAHRVVEYVAERFAPVSKQRIVVVCGKGNNGGDGLVAARHLASWGISVRVLMFADPATTTTAAAENWFALTKTRISTDLPSSVSP